MRMRNMVSATSGGHSTRLTGVGHGGTAWIWIWMARGRGLAYQFALIAVIVHSQSREWAKASAESCL